MTINITGVITYWLSHLESVHCAHTGHGGNNLLTTTSHIDQIMLQYYYQPYKSCDITYHMLQLMISYLLYSHYGNKP